MSSQTQSNAGELPEEDREAFEYLLEHSDDPVVQRISEAFLQSSEDDGESEEANS